MMIIRMVTIITRMMTVVVVVTVDFLHTDEDDRRGQYGNSLSGLLITQLLNQLIALVTKIKIIITT